MTMTTLGIAAMIVGALLVAIAVAGSGSTLLSTWRGAAPMPTRKARRATRPMQPRIG